MSVTRRRFLQLLGATAVSAPLIKALKPFELFLPQAASGQLTYKMLRDFSDSIIVRSPFPLYIMHASTKAAYDALLAGDPRYK